MKISPAGDTHGYFLGNTLFFCITQNPYKNNVGGEYFFMPNVLFYCLIQVGIKTLYYNI